VAKSRKSKPPSPAAWAAPPADFEDVLRLIDAARGRAVAAVNRELINLYWNIGEHISRRIAADGWGRGPSRPWPSTSGAASPPPGASPPATSGG
jgi:uncharacterized protein DUF1016